jgi:hypothetical protein
MSRTIPNPTPADLADRAIVDYGFGKTPLRSTDLRRFAKRAVARSVKAWARDVKASADLVPAGLIEATTAYLVAYARHGSV